MLTDYLRLRVPSKRDTILFLRRAIGFALPFFVLSILLLAISLSFGLVGGIDTYFGFEQNLPFSLLVYEGFDQVRSYFFDHELPFLLLVYASLFYLMRPGAWRAVIAAIPIIVLYLGMDLYYVFMHSIFKLDDLLLLPEGLTVSPVWARIGVVAGCFLWITAFLVSLRRRPRELVLPLLLLMIAATPPIAAYTAPKYFLEIAGSRGLNVIPWSDRWTSACVGRATSLLLFAATKHKAIAELALLPPVDDPSRNPEILKSTLRDTRNVHILVLESFFDPERFKGLKFKTPAIPPRFKPIHAKAHVSISPVFGGGTAQAEFELLCGVPALELYTSAEFNMLDGARAPCLPNMLAEAGYRTVATQSYKPDFFNSEKAYRSLGFQETNFPTAFAGSRSTYLQYDDTEHYIFDGDLLSQNLAYVEKLMADGRPFLNYVLGVYGHLPHETDLKRFPPKVEVEGVGKNSQTYLAIQQFYYRAEAVADYLQKLRKVDPNSLIVITSDHLPPLDGGPRVYKNFGYNLSENGEYKQNIWFYDGPQHKRLAWPDHHYEFMDFILDVLTEERICTQVVCKNRESWPDEKIKASYNNIMSLGAGIVRRPTALMAGASAGAGAAPETTESRL